VLNKVAVVIIDYLVFLVVVPSLDLFVELNSFVCQLGYIVVFVVILLVVAVSLVVVVVVFLVVVKRRNLVASMAVKDILETPNC